MSTPETGHENGQMVLTVKPVYPGDGKDDPDTLALRKRERAETIAWVLRVLFAGEPDLEQVARRACALAYVTQAPDAPAKSIRDLAEHFRVSPTRAAQICTLLRQIILENPRD